jgi:hypothetical protein
MLTVSEIDQLLESKRVCDYLHFLSKASKTCTPMTHVRNDALEQGPEIKFSPLESSMESSLAFPLSGLAEAHHSHTVR